jgi:DNA-binding NarL/FixJ family response regulator
MTASPDGQSDREPHEERHLARRRDGAVVTAPSAAIEVLVVEDDPGTQAALIELIGSSKGLHIIGACDSAERALRWPRQPSPNVILLDVELPGTDGASAVGDILARFPNAAIVMLTARGDDETIFRAICAGASGYLLKHTPPETLVSAILAAREGGAPMTPSVASRVVSLFRRVVPKASDTQLSQQELRVLSLLAEGHSYASSGEEMGVSVNTIRNYIRSVYEKLHVHSKSEAVSKALRRGLI